MPISHFLYSRVMKSNLYPFHLAMPVANLAKAMNFYENVLGLERGRHSEKWADYNFFGHQVVFHEADEVMTKKNPVDGHQVPVPHFGVAMDFEEWNRLAKLLQEKKVEFVIEPNIRFKGLAGEQGTFFIKDPNGLCLEFKAFKNPEKLFEGN